MTTAEAKTKITEEMHEGFLEWLKDLEGMSENDFGKKYGWIMNKEKQYGFDLRSFLVYREYFFLGRYIPYWEKAGYERQAIYDLHKEKWLSYTYYSNWKARASNRTEWYFIPVRTAKEIWKEISKAA